MIATPKATGSIILIHRTLSSIKISSPIKNETRIGDWVMKTITSFHNLKKIMWN